MVCDFLKGPTEAKNIFFTQKLHTIFTLIIQNNEVIWKKKKKKIACKKSIIRWSITICELQLSVYYIFVSWPSQKNINDSNTCTLEIHIHVIILFKYFSERNVLFRPLSTLSPNDKQKLNEIHLEIKKRIQTAEVCWGTLQ